MKLLRYGDPGTEKPGILDGDSIRDLSGLIDDWDPSTINANTFARIAAVDLASLPAVDGNPRIGACVGSPGKFIALGSSQDGVLRAAPYPTFFSVGNSRPAGNRDPGGEFKMV